MSKSILGIILVVLGVILNNVVYLQDLWFGQESITLDSWRAIAGILVSIGIVVVGLWLVGTAAGKRPNGG